MLFPYYDVHPSVLKNDFFLLAGKLYGFSKKTPFIFTLHYFMDFVADYTIPPP